MTMPLLLLLILIKSTGVPGFGIPYVPPSTQLSAHGNGVSKSTQLSTVADADAGANTDADAEGFTASGNHELMEAMRIMMESHKNDMMDEQRKFQDEQRKFLETELSIMAKDQETHNKLMAEKAQGMEDEQRKYRETHNKREGFLIEDSLRTMALKRGYSDYFCEPCTIKCILDIIMHISEGGTDKVPTGKGRPETDKRKHAENDVVEFLNRFLSPSVESAARAVFEQSKTDEFEHEVFAEAKAIILQATQEIIKAGSTVKVEVLAQYMGKIINGVDRLSKITPPNDDEGAACQRMKLTRGKFSNKLNRIKWALSNRENALTDCQGPGVLLLGAVSSVYKQYLRKEEGSSTGEYDMDALAKWVAQECDIFRFKEQLECDFQGRLELDSCSNTAIIYRGEAKASISGYTKGVQQMDEQARAIEFALAITFKDQPFVVRKEHYLFVYDAAGSSQRNNTLSKDGACVFVEHNIQD
jgi:hypothetical protein